MNTPDFSASLGYWLIAVAVGFLSGSVLYSKLLPRLFLKKDIC